MTESTTGASTSGPTGYLRSILVDAPILLAISSAAAYLVAFAFEIGWADTFGYPWWLIDVTWVRALTSWTILLGTALIVFDMIFTFVGALPARPAKALIFSRLGLQFLSALFLGGVGTYLLVKPGLSPTTWLGLTMLVFSGASAIALVLTVGGLYRKTPQEESWASRMEGSVKAFAEKQRAERGPDSLKDHIYRNTRYGRGLLNGLLIAFSFLTVLSVADELGGFYANRQSTFFTTNADSLTWVAIRRYGDQVVAMPLQHDGKTLLRRYRLIALDGRSMTWVPRILHELRFSDSPPPRVK